METNLEEVEGEVPKIEIVCNRGVGKCRCSELEERSKKAEAKCVKLEIEVQKRKSDYEVLETKFRILESAKLALEVENEGLKSHIKEYGDHISHNESGNVVDGEKEVMEGVVDLTEENDEEDKVFQLMAENKVLECEKSKAESEVEVWKQKFKELELLTLQLQKSLVLRSSEQISAASGNKTIKAIDSKDRSRFGNTLNNMPAIEKVVDFMDSGSALVSSHTATGNLQTAGTPFIDTPYKDFTSDEGDYSRLQSNKRVKRHLAFQEERCTSKGIAPSTPNVAKPTSVSVININDSDDEPDSFPLYNKESGKGNISTNYELNRTVGRQNEIGEIGDQNQAIKADHCVDNVPLISVLRRKRALNIANSDTESDDDDDDDDIPICKLRRFCCQEVAPNQTAIEPKVCKVDATPPVINDVKSAVTPRRRRLVSLRQSEGKNGIKCSSSKKSNENEVCKGIPTTEDVEDDNSADSGSDSETDSMNGFIVDDSDLDTSGSESQEESDCNNAHSESEDVFSSNNARSDLNDVSDDELGFEKILSQLKRNKDHKSDWKLEAELLAAFGKDLELCMKGVCAIYRQQTSGEKLSKATLLQNGRGFSKFDAYRGCTLAEFLTDGDPQGDLKKSVKELQAYDPKAAELCRDLATRYSKQLFEIYNSKEDPYFRSS